MQDYQNGTQCLHAGYVPENGEPRNIPIVQSTTFRYATSEAMGALFDLEAAGYFYTRLQNPTSDRVAAKICALEGGTAAMLTSSGQAANFFAIFNICSAGDHVVASATIYGGTFNLFSVTMKRMGIEFTFVDPNCSEAELNAAFRPNTKAVFGETIANPALIVLDLEKFAKAAHSHGVPLIVDNTFATPIGCQPVRVGRGHRDPLHHQIHGRPRQLCGRRHCGQRQLRLDQASRQVPRPLHPRRELPRRDLHRALRPGRGLHHQGHGPAHAGPRRHPRPHERLSC